MKTLIVGAGAVGSVYGHTLFKAGCPVSFFVKEKYKAELKEEGLQLHNWNREDPQTGKHPESVLWKDFEVLTTVQEVQASEWDLVVFTMASTGLKGPWLEPFLKALGPHTLLVSLQPGMHDQEYLSARFDPKRLIEGSIPIISYPAPLPHEKLNPGIAYYTPPGAKALFQGKHLRLSEVVALFNRGGLSSKEEKPGSKSNEVMGTILTLFIAALRESDWKLERVKSSPLLKTACRAMREVLAEKGPLTRALLHPPFITGLLWASRKLMPFDLEAYLKLHFTKVGEQMKQGLVDYIEAAKAKGEPHEALLALKKATENS